MIDVKAAVIQRYATDLIDLDRTQFEEVVAAETERLLMAIAQMQSQTELEVIATWRAANGGADPDVMTLTGLYTQARVSAEETVLTSELWEGYHSLEDDPTPEASGEEDCAVDQWRRGWPVEATPEMVGRAETTWPGQTTQFLVWAEQLLQARMIDGLPIPDGPNHQLVAELTATVHAAIAQQASADAARRARQ